MVAKPDKPDKPTEAESVVRRTLAIISAFSFAEPVLGVSELSRRLELPKSTVHRLLASLVAEGFAERTPDDRYRLALKLYEIGQQVVSSHVLRQVGHAPLEKLRNDSGETAHLAVLSGADVVYIDRFESAHMVRLMTRIGRRRAAHATSSGKCLLAFGAPADVDVVVKGGLQRMAPRTLTTAPLLTASLREVRKKGYAVSVDESAPDIVSVGAPIYDGSGACTAAVSIAGPSFRMTSDDLDRYIQLVLRTAAQISKALAKEQARLAT